MEPILQSQIFFFISSVGFIILGILAAIFLYYLIRSMHTFDRIMSKLEQDIHTIGDATKEMVHEVKESFIFNLLFGKKKKRLKK